MAAVQNVSRLTLAPLRFTDTGEFACVDSTNRSAVYVYIYGKIYRTSCAFYTVRTALSIMHMSLTAHHIRMKPIKVKFGALLLLFAFTIAILGLS